MGEVKECGLISDTLIQICKGAARDAGTPDYLISRIELVMQNSTLFSQGIVNLPFPVALFEKSGTVVLANRLLLWQAGIIKSDIEGRKINLLDCVTDGNHSVFKAVEDVFLGDTTVVKNLVSPLSLFSKNIPRDETALYYTAVFLPIPCSNGIRYGVVMLTH